MQILVDADACPVKEIIVRLAKKQNIPVTMLIDTSHRLNDDYSKTITVDKQADSVDFALMSLLVRDDIIVTQYYGLAAMVLGKGARAINQNGFAYTAELFSRHMNAKCLSIEENADFASEIESNDTVTICYPIYFSRVPLIMREFVARYMTQLKGKRLIIFATQLILSSDGARVLYDLFPKAHVEVIYAEHFFMPNNVCNTPILPQPSGKTIERCKKRAEAKMLRVCENIRNGKVVKRGFSVVGHILGLPQGLPWQRDTSITFAVKGTLEYRTQHGIKIHKGCNVCNACIKCCPINNLENHQGSIVHKNNCTACYRCVNLCPKQAITLLLNHRPKWQYKGLGDLGKVNKQNHIIREIAESEYPLLEDFLYHAIFILDGEERPERNIIFEPEIYIYIKDFGGKDDCGVVIEVDGKIVGAAWTRIIPAYGNIDDKTPGLAISVLPKHRGQGIGTDLMTSLFELLRKQGYARTSLSVQQNNSAVRFYQRLGYVRTDEKVDHASHEDYIMIKNL